MKTKPQRRWLKEPKEHDYPAAQFYLSLTMDEALAIKLVKKLRPAPIKKFKAKVSCFGIAATRGGEFSCEEGSEEDSRGGPSIAASLRPANETGTSYYHGRLPSAVRDLLDG